MGDASKEGAQQAADRRWLKRAIGLADRGRFGISPNPAVGCVLVSDDRRIGQGWHRHYGGHHAEVEALQDCQRRWGGEAAGLLRRATAYISLEPCAHQGNTPPCTEALIQAGVDRIVCALSDPNRRVAGKGIQALRQAGMEVHCGADEQLKREAVLGNLGYLSRHLRSRPWLTLKLAASMDGRTALQDGTSQWITGEQARGDVQTQRAWADVILTGIGTILADNPRLLPRLEEMPAAVRRDLPASLAEGKKPLRLVLDSALRTPTDAALFSVAGPVAIVHVETNLRQGVDALPGAECIVLPAGADGRCALEQLMPLLYERGCNRILAECGPTLAGALMKSALVDEVLLYQSGKVLGSDARPLWQLDGFGNLNEVAFQLASHRQFGADIRLQWVRTSALESLSI